MANVNEHPPAAARRPTPPPVRRPAEVPSWPVRARPVVDIVARILCLLLGAALVVAGLVGLFTDVDQGPLLIVLVAGLLLLIVPSIVDRIRSMRIGEFEVDLIRQIAENARKTADILRRHGMGPELDAYASIYLELHSPDLAAVRGQVLDRLTQRVSQASAVEKFDSAEVRDLFLHGSPIVRVLALGLIEGDLSLVDSDVLLDAVNRSLTAYEQFHALKVTRNGWGRLTPEARRQLMVSIDANPQIQAGSDRRDLAEEIRGLAGSPRTR